MDYWELATSDIKYVISALSGAKGLNSAARTFIEHASLFGEGGIPNYPRWSEELGVLRDTMLRSEGDPLICEIANLLTKLIWEWEYGAMEEEGYKSSQHLAVTRRSNSTVHWRFKRYQLKQGR